MREVHWTELLERCVKLISKIDLLYENLFCYRKSGSHLVHEYTRCTLG